MFQEKRVVLFTILFLVMISLFVTTTVDAAKTYEQLKTEQASIEKKYSDAKCDIPNKRVATKCAPIEKSLKSINAQLAAYSKNGGYTKGTNEIPFWGDVPNTDENKAIDISDLNIDDSIAKVNGGEWQGVDGEGVKVVKSKVEQFVYIISALMFGFAVIMVTFAGFNYATSEGDAKKTQQAKTQIMAAGIGIGISLFNLVIIQLFASIINVFN